jgi:hypothetical protein
LATEGFDQASHRRGGVDNRAQVSRTNIMAVPFLGASR